MRRKWIIGLSLSAAILALLLAPTAPYGFLGPHRPVSDSTVDDRTSPLAAKTQILEYTFEADYEEVLEQAHRELSSQGFRLQQGNATNRAVFFKSPSASQKPDVVVLIRDTRVRLGVPLRDLGRDPGWICVQIVGRAEPTLVESVRSRLGI